LTNGRISVISSYYCDASVKQNTANELIPGWPSNIIEERFD